MQPYMTPKVIGGFFTTISAIVGSVYKIASWRSGSSAPTTTPTPVPTPVPYNWDAETCFAEELFTCDISEQPVEVKTTTKKVLDKAGEFAKVVVDNCLGKDEKTCTDSIRKFGSDLVKDNVKPEDVKGYYELGCATIGKAVGVDKQTVDYAIKTTAGLTAAGLPIYYLYSKRLERLDSEKVVKIIYELLLGIAEELNNTQSNSLQLISPVVNSKQSIEVAKPVDVNTKIANMIEGAAAKLPKRISKDLPGKVKYIQEILSSETKTREVMKKATGEKDIWEDYVNESTKALDEVIKKQSPKNK